jgi:hypothetical protein
MPARIEADGWDQTPDMSSSLYMPDDAQTVKEQSRRWNRLLSALKRGLREPLVYFLAIGFALFSIYGAMNQGAGLGGSVNHQIELTVDDLRQLEIAFVSQWDRQPTPEEFTGLVENHIREEILYREGLALLSFS